MKDLRTLNSYRSIDKQRLLGTDHLRKSVYGIFDIPLSSEESAIAIADNGLSDLEWEHVSVSTAYRCLTWEEMCKIKDMFFFEDEVVMQLHPAKKNYVNFHDYTLHLWKPKTKEIPLPPSILVL